MALHGSPKWPVGQVVKTRPFHGCNMGSNPVRVTTSAIRKGCRSYGGLAQLVRAPASHAGGHWFESSSLHQEESLEPQGFEDSSFPRTRKYWAAGLAVICGKLRSFFMPLLQKCCKFFLSFNPLRRNGLEDFSVSAGDYILLQQDSHLCKDVDCCKFATIEQN